MPIIINGAPDHRYQTVQTERANETDGCGSSAKQERAGKVRNKEKGGGAMSRRPRWAPSAGRR